MFQVSFFFPIGCLLKCTVSFTCVFFACLTVYQNNFCNSECGPDWPWLTVIHAHLCSVIVFLITSLQGCEHSVTIHWKVPGCWRWRCKGCLAWSHLSGQHGIRYGDVLSSGTVHVHFPTHKRITLLNVIIAVVFKRRQLRHDRYECGHNATGNMT